MNEELQSTNEELQTVNEELRQRTDEMNRLNAFLESVLAGLSSGAVVVNANFDVMMWNHKAEDMWGLRADEAQGKSLFSLDIGLPVESGYDLIRRVRSLPSEARNIPAVALTAFATEKDRQLAISAGFQMHLAKPVDPDVLIEAIERLARPNHDSGKQ